jgi:hypothetical protein
MRPLNLLLIAAAASLTGACSQPFEGRVASRLAEAGLSRGMADCMASRWVDRLNVLQLRKIQSLSEDLGREGRGLTVGRFIDRVRAMDDPEVVQVVTTSAAACALS